MVRRGLFFCRRRGLKGFGIFGEVLCSVGAVKAFWKDDERGTRASGFENFGAGMGEVVGFVGAFDLLVVDL